MKRSILRWAAFGLLATAMALVPTQGFTQEKSNNTASTEKKESSTGKKKKSEGLPYRGKIRAIDKQAKTVTVREKVFQVTLETKIIKGGKPAKLENGVVGDEVAFYYKKADDGKLIALSVRFGPRPEGQGKSKKAKKKESS